MRQIQATETRETAPPKARRNNSVRTPWTGERVDFLIALWADGIGETCPYIAKYLNTHTKGGHITSGAVIGKIYRLGLTHKDRSLRQRQAEAAKRAKRGEAPTRKRGRFVVLHKKSQPMPVFRDNVIPLRIPFVEIVNHQCHYVVGEVADLVYCGHERAAGSLWCEAHRERCTQRPRR